MNGSKVLIKIINDSKLLINKEIYLKVFIDKINKEIIKNIDKEINEKYSIKNLSNIFDFVKTQNLLLPSEIIENILITIFSFTFKTEKTNSFGKLLYKNMDLIKRMKNSDLINWLQLNEFKKELLGEKSKNFENFLEIDYSHKKNSQINQMNDSQIQPIISFLLIINKNKLEIPKYENETKYKNLEEISTADTKKTLSNVNLYSDYLHKDKLGLVSNIPISLFKSFLISVYIYYQNKYSPLIEFTHESREGKKLSIIPFEYNLSEAVIESDHSSIIFSPIRIEPRIEYIKMPKNFLKETSLLEFSKVLLFNKNIRIIDFHTCMLKSSCIYYFNTCSIFNNYSIEELNLSFNFLKEDSSEFLAHLLLNLKNLKTIILSSNDLKSGISSFLIILKNLYRKQQTKLESLYLNNCILDDIAFYELGELLKNKFCKLKNLYLNSNNIPSNVKFLKNLKKNNSLIQIYFNNSNIEKKDTDDIMKIISNTKINCLYLNKNKITDFSQLIRIIYRTKLIKSENEGDLISEPYFYNLDLSDNQCYNKNKDKIDLFKQAIKETTLYCLDFCHILYNRDPGRVSLSAENKEFRKAIDSIIIDLEKETNESIQIIGELNNLNVDIKKIKEIEYKELFIEMEDEIDEIIDKEEVKFPLYIKKQIPKIIFKYEKTREKILNNGELDKKEYKRISDDLEKYINLRLLKQNLQKLENKKSKIKKIII